MSFFIRNSQSVKTKHGREPMTARTSGTLIPTILFLCFVLHQFGPSYHLSFGSLGLALLFLVFRKDISNQSLKASVVVATLMLLSIELHLVRYGNEGTLLREFRFILNAVALFLLLNLRFELRPPSVWLVGSAVVFLFLLCCLQNFGDGSLRVPDNWYALSGRDEEFSDFAEYGVRTVFRVSGPYTEPSVLGLVLSCLMAICLKFKTKAGLWLTALCAVSIFLTGSLLGLVGLAGIFLLELRSSSLGRSKILLMFLILGLGLSLFMFIGDFKLALLERSYAEGGALDDSTLTRLVYPFILIGNNFANMDLLGYPGNLYDHFFYTGLYHSRSSFPGHNGFLGVVMAFGVTGILTLWYLFRRVAGWEEAFLIVLIGSQSGNFFSYEKVFLMLYVPMLIRGLTSSFEIRASSRNLYRAASS